MEILISSIVAGFAESPEKQKFMQYDCMREVQVGRRVPVMLSCNTSPTTNYGWLKWFACAIRSTQIQILKVQLFYFRLGFFKEDTMQLI